MAVKSKNEHSINGWMVGSDPYDRNKYQRLHSGESFRVYLCPNCSRVHEDTYFNGEGRQTVYHADFPTYGMKRETCKLCEKS